MPPHFFDFGPSSAAQWFSAVGTIAAVILALYRDAIAVWWRKPKLEVSCSKESPWTHKTPIAVQGPKGLWKGDGYYVRLRVKNAGGTRAEKVQVFVAGASRVGIDNSEKTMADFLPMNLKWSHSPADKPVIIFDGIAPEMAAFCDVIGISDPSNNYQERPSNTPEGATVAQLQLEVGQPFSGFHLLCPGRYRLRLLVAAANVKAITKVLDFEHTGKWLPNDEDMRRECLRISIN